MRAEFFLPHPEEAAQWSPRRGGWRARASGGSWKGTVAGVTASILLSLTSAPAAAETSGAVLRGLDKITARISTFEAPLEQEIGFGTLRIIVHACRKRPPEEPPEVSVFLDITEERPGEEHRIVLFNGWMFASSPALSALEHPVYDVWVIDCSTSEEDSAEPPSEKSAE